MRNPFKKLTKGANRFFNKVGHDTEKFFKKDVVNVANKVGGAFEDAGRETLDGLKKTGNFLEKNAGIIGDVAGAGLMASGFGAPVGLAVMAGGNVAQQAGTDLKNASSRIRQSANAIGAQARTTANQMGADINANARNLQRQANQAVNKTISNAKTRANSMIDQTTNQLNGIRFA